MSLAFLRAFAALHFQVLVFNAFCHSEAAPRYTFVHEATTAPLLASFDYIVIGGGTSGCPLAATLSQSAAVLLLERGGSPYDNPSRTDITNFAANLGDVSHTSPAQQFVSTDGVTNARARVLGGGSVLNAGFYTRAPADYVARSGWNPDQVRRSYEWVERKVAFEPRVMAWQSAVRDGLLEAGVLPNNGFTYDHITGTKIGGTIFDTDGHRHTAADLLDYADPSNIVVYLRAVVHKILLSNIGAKPKAAAVIFQDAFGVFHTAQLTSAPNSEVILSAGALGSPQLLMLSGIGPATQLVRHGIPVVLEQPMVGQGMSDNPMNALFVPSPLPVELSLIQVVGITRFGSYIEAASGEQFGIKLPAALKDLSTIFNQTLNASAIPDVIQAMSSPSRGGVILEKVMGPSSTGHLELVTLSPYDNPSVTFNYFQSPEDLQRCVQGMKTIIDVVNSRAFSKFRYKRITVQNMLQLMAQVPSNLRPRHRDTGTSLERFCIDTVLTIWHYHGGCQVGKVVDEDYKVKGVDSLRVIDGSTFIDSPGTNPQATVMMLGRYMGEKILQQRSA